MFKVILVLLTLILAACQPLPAVQVTPQAPLKVSVSPSLNWLENDLAACAASAGTAVQRADSESVDADILLQLGGNENEAYAAVLGQEQLAVIVHPNNPLTEVSLEDAQAIFSGQMTTWPDGSEILAWSLPASSDVHAALLEAGFAFNRNGLAANPQIMLTAVAGNPAAIGYLPVQWVDDSVRVLEVTGLQIEIPILAISAQEPQGQARALLVCLQEKIAP